MTKYIPLERIQNMIRLLPQSEHDFMYQELMNLPTIDPIATIDEMIEDVNKRNKETVQDKVLCIVLK